MAHDKPAGKPVIRAASEFTKAAKKAANDGKDPLDRSQRKPPEKSLIRLRHLTVRTLAQVFNSSQTLDQCLFQELTRKNDHTLPDFERAWIYEICSGVLRYKGRLDYIIDTYALKKKPTGALRRYLQTAVFQLLAEGVPSALVVSETVQAVKETEGPQPSQFVNAILRKVADSRDEWQKWEVTKDSPVAEQIAWCSLPEWIFYSLRKERGIEWAFSFAQACLERPRTWYRNLETNEAMLLEGGFRGDEPRGYVQDISNQLLVDAVVKVLREKFGDKKPKILDLCSAPGGKSLGLATNGYSVTATDIDSTRLQKVVENKSRLQLNDEINVAEFKTIWASEDKYDVIWLDAPCSSSGIIRRHPEVKWNREESDLKPLQQKQQELVAWAAEHLNEGGILVYSTCSVLKGENLAAIDGFTDLGSHEWFPQEEPHGDAILSIILGA